MLSQTNESLKDSKLFLKILELIRTTMSENETILVPGLYLYIQDGDIVGDPVYPEYFGKETENDTLQNVPIHNYALDTLIVSGQVKEKSYDGFVKVQTVPFLSSWTSVGVPVYIFVAVRIGHDWTFSVEKVVYHEGAVTPESMSSVERSTAAMALFGYPSGADSWWM